MSIVHPDQIQPTSARRRSWRLQPIDVVLIPGLAIGGPYATWTALQEHHYLGAVAYPLAAAAVALFYWRPGLLRQLTPGRFALMLGAGLAVSMAFRALGGAA
jgi:hypothetical protein